MKKIISLIVCVAVMAVSLCVTASAEESKIKVACVGDSITDGGENFCEYPANLQKFLDADKYEVKNFGFGGTTAMKNPYVVPSYWSKQEFTDSKEYNPDIVIIMLGTNDVVNENWNLDDYTNDLTELVETYQNLSSAPTVYLCTPPSAFNASHPEKLAQYAVPTVKEIATQTDATLVDVNALTADMGAYFSDGIHPNNEGYVKLAQIFYEQIFGGKVTELTVKADAGTKVIFAGQQKTVDANGEVKLVTGNGRKEIKFETASGYTYVDVAVRGKTYADCTGLYIPENIAPTATVSDKDGEVTKATDGDSSTGWQRTDGIENCWLQFDFGSAKEVNSIEIEWESGTRPSNNGYKIEYSDNGTSWTELPNAAYGVGDINDTVTCDTVTARYLKISCSAGTSDKWRPQIFECRIQKISTVPFAPVTDYAESENFDANRFELQTVSGDVRFVATNVYGDKIPVGKIIKADYTVIRNGATAPFTGTVYIGKAYSSIVFGDVEITIDDLKSGETEGYVTGVLFTNVLPSDVIKVEFSLVDAD